MAHVYVIVATLKQGGKSIELERQSYATREEAVAWAHRLNNDPVSKFKYRVKAKSV